MAAATENSSELFTMPPDVRKGQKDVLAGGQARLGPGLGGRGRQAGQRRLKMLPRHLRNVIPSVTTLRGRCYELRASECDHGMS